MKRRIQKYLLSFFFVSFILIIIIFETPLNPLVKQVPILVFLVRILISISLFSCMLLLFSIGIDSISMSIIANLGLYLVILTIITEIDLFNESLAARQFTFTTIGLVFILLLLNIYVMSFNICIQQKPKMMNIDNKYNVFYKKILSFINRIEKFFYKYNYLVIPVLFIVLVLMTVLTFTCIYETYNYSELDGGIYYNNTLNENNKVMNGYDLIYFSTVTFFTVGYGDIVPVGGMIKLIVQFEIIIGYILGVIYLPLLIGLFNNVFSRRNLKNQ